MRGLSRCHTIRDVEGGPPGIERTSDHPTFSFGGGKVATQRANSERSWFLVPHNMRRSWYETHTNG